MSRDDIETIVLVWLMGMGCAGILGIGACATVSKAPTTQPCLTKPPPEQAAFHPTQGGTQGCASIFMWCLSPESGVKLANNMSAYREWTQEAWDRCGR